MGALAAVGTVWAAIAATFAGYFTYRIMLAGQHQVEVSHEQFRQSVEAERDSQLPVLMPIHPLHSLGHGTPDGYGHLSRSSQLGYDRTQPFARVALRNVGPGIALNVSGVVFPSEPELAVHKVTGQIHSYRYPLPLLPGSDDTKEWLAGGPPVSGDTEIGRTTRYKFYAPKRPTFVEAQRGITEMQARLVLTYADIFGRKHAAIFDLTAQHHWENVAYLRNIEDDLRDLEQKALSQVPVYRAPAMLTATDGSIPLQG